jgi:DNA invertase Pin-like site-specific DNA recombinase
MQMSLCKNYRPPRSSPTESVFRAKGVISIADVPSGGGHIPMTERVPAAQYLRVSTDHQQYSLENQSAAIRKYAELRNFEIPETYTDAARTGVILKRRSGLQHLLADVVSGNTAYRAILVYDVSRWGRFQDTDEAAHYEFVCKSAGVPVHYCAETFPNDDTISSLIMKALKRAMAGEYSRELGVKVFAGQKRLAQLGFKLGGRSGYGLRRMLVTSAKVPKQLLAFGERKSIATDRVILVPGPDEEVGYVREIFRMLVSQKRTVYSIACELNERRVPYLDSQWDYQAVYNILTHPKYAGFSVFARSSRKLYTPTVKLPKSQWVVTPGAFASVVDVETFNRAQEILGARTPRNAATVAGAERKVIASIDPRLPRYSVPFHLSSPLWQFAARLRTHWLRASRSIQEHGFAPPDVSPARGANRAHRCDVPIPRVDYSEGRKMANPPSTLQQNHRLCVDRPFAPAAETLHPLANRSPSRGEKVRDAACETDT